MEEYFVKMHTNPEVVDAVTDRVCQFYWEANERFFAAAGDLVDGFFFGNDFGTQQSLICGPRQFDRFILPLVPQVRSSKAQPRLPGRAALVRLDPSCDRPADRGRRRLPPPASGQGGEHGRRDPRPRFQGADRVPGRHRHCSTC